MDSFFSVQCQPIPVSECRYYQNMKALADKKGCTPGQLALAWVHHQGPDVFPIPGTTVRKFDQLFGLLALRYPNNMLLLCVMWPAFSCMHSFPPMAPGLFIQTMTQGCYCSGFCHFNYNNTIFSTFPMQNGRVNNWKLKAVCVPCAEH